MPEPTVRPYRIWVRRSTEPGGSYALRFEATRGKGLLRVVRPGVMVDPPARTAGVEEGLTASQVLQSRYIHAADGGRPRQQVLFGRIDLGVLSSLEPEVWHECGDQDRDGRRYATLGPPPADEDEDVDDAPTDVQRMIAELRAHLRDATPVVDDAPMLVVHGSSMVGEVASFGNVLAEPGQSPAVPVEPPRQPGGPEPSPAVTSAPAGAPPESASDDGWAGVAFHARTTTLVRHLRRQIERGRLRILELEEEVRRLSARGPTPSR